MASMNPNLILQASQTPDILGAMSQGNALAQQVNAQRQQAAQNAFYRENGQGLMAGDTNALAGLAQFDPQAAFGMRRQVQEDAWRQEDRQYQRGRDARQDSRADEKWQMQVAEYAASKSAAERAAEAAQIEDAVKMGLAAQSPQEWDALVQQAGAADLVGQFDSRQAIAQRYMSVAEILKGQQGGESFRPASADEAGQYGAQAGQFGPNGRFYPINPPSGLAIETGPDGQMRVTQGVGAGSAAGKPFTEGQSKNNAYVTRATGALEVLDPIAGALTSRGERAAEYVPMGLARGAQSDEFQVAKNAGDEFLQAILRNDTGAAITEQEQALYGTTYLPQPGDSDAVQQQKAQARRRALEAIKSGMSPAQMVAVEKGLAASAPPAAAQQGQRLRFNPETGDFE